MKKYLALLILIGGIAAMFPSCYYEDIEFDEVIIPDSVSFSVDIVPIFVAGCNASVCHGGSKDPDLRPENAYDALMNGGFVNTADPASSSIYTCLLPGGSMNSYAKQGNADLILAWIEQGAKNN
jgi:hypothetical protein